MDSDIKPPFPHNGVFIEWAPFRTAPGVTAGEVVAASEQVHREFLARQPGFLARQLLQKSASEWADLVWWTSDEAAHSAMHKVQDSKACSRYFSLMDFGIAQPGAGLEFFQRVAVYG